MTLATYSDLTAAVGNWLNRSDLTARIPEFIALAEAEFNRTLRTIDMEARSTATLTGEALALPDDFNGLRSISQDNNFFTLVSSQDLFNTSTTGSAPRLVAISDGQFFFRPAPSSGTVSIAYYATIPPLTTGSPTNWLMTKHPDLYLFATLAQAEFYGWNDDRLPLVKARTEELIDQINGHTNKVRYGNRTIQMKAEIA